MALAPNPGFRERENTSYETKTVPARGGRRGGPLRFEEGIATDTDVPNDFALGASQGAPSPARPNHNVNVFEKSAEETNRERAHVGSASWVEAPSMLGEFAAEASGVGRTVEIERVSREQVRHERQNPARVRG